MAGAGQVTFLKISYCSFEDVSVGGMKAEGRGGGKRERSRTLEEKEERRESGLKEEEGEKWSSIFIGEYDVCTIPLE